MTAWMDFRGELAALTAALLWAAASVVYGRLGQQVAPLILNLAKGLIAIALLLLTILVRGEFGVDLPPIAVVLLLLSGVIGIGLGDTAYFEALNCLGPRRVLVMEALAPPLAALLALSFLQEQLGLTAWLGIGLTLAGVIWVITERATTVQIQMRPWRGIGFGCLAALGQASGAVLSRAALAGTAVSPLWSTLLRLAAGVGVLLLLVGLQKPSDRGLAPLTARQIWVMIAITAFFSTYLAIWLQQISLKYAATGVAQALSSTSPLFILPIAAALGERISLRSIVGVLVALAGVWLLFSRA